MEIYSVNDLEMGYTCPITLEEPEIPVRTRCGHTFDKVALLHALSRNPTCPLCRSDVNENELENLAPRVHQAAEDVLQSSSPQIERPQIQNLPAQVNPVLPLNQQLNNLVQASQERQAIEQQLVGHEREVADRLATHQAEVEQKIFEIMLRLTS